MVEVYQKAGLPTSKSKFITRFAVKDYPLSGYSAEIEVKRRLGLTSLDNNIRHPYYIEGSRLGDCVIDTYDTNRSRYVEVKYLPKYSIRAPLSIQQLQTLRLYNGVLVYCQHIETKKDLYIYDIRCIEDTRNLIDGISFAWNLCKRNNYDIANARSKPSVYVDQSYKPPYKK